MSILTGVFLFVGLGLAVKHSAFILLYGSVFESTRTFVDKRMRTGSWLFTKVNELFTCNLCMTAQMSIWLVAVPVTIGLHMRYGHVAELVLATELPLIVEIGLALFLGFMISMSTAALAMGLWSLTEYLPKRMELVKKIEAEKLSAYSRLEEIFEISERQGHSLQEILALLAVQKEVSETRLNELVSRMQAFEPTLNKFSFEDFKSFVLIIEQESMGIGCGFERRNKRKETLNRLVSEWASSHSAGSRDKRTLLNSLSKSMREYFHKKKYYEDEDKEELLLDLFGDLWENLN